MSSCSGCGKTLGYRKYKFHRMWRIPGYYCKECMLILGKDFDVHGKIVTPKRCCDLCNVEYHFLKSHWHEKKQKNYCETCLEAVKSGAIPDKTLGQKPGKLPQVLMIFAGLGILMMALGLVFTLMVTPSGETNLVNILFGAVTTALGFVIFRKTIKSRNLILGQIKKQEIESLK